MKAALGFSNVHVFGSGAAPISPDIVEFFAGLDIRILEVYGQSEDTGPTSFNRKDQYRLGTVGPAYPGTEVKIAEDGEILVKGPHVFKGYYKNEDATAETVMDDYLYSGDLGEFDNDGFLKITGRKKDLIITAGGKNIAPALIEGQLKNHTLISEAVVVGDRRKYLTALITLESEEAENFVSERGLPEAPYEAPALLEVIEAAVEEVNSHLARVEQVKKFSVLPRELSIEEGELTPTLKVKRNVVNEKYAREIAAFYAEGKPAAQQARA